MSSNDDTTNVNRRGMLLSSVAGAATAGSV